MSRKGRRRVRRAALRTTVITLLLAGSVLGALYIARIWTEAPRRLAVASDTPPIGRLDLATDGVLDGEWLRRTLALPAGATLVEIDPDALKSRLEKDPQVIAAIVTKRFPSSLQVRLQERVPVARILAEEPGGNRRELLVARDGVVYAGSGYDRARIDSLPWLAGIALKTDGSGYAPVAGMDRVADLLNKARDEAPHLFDTWRVIDLSRLSSDREIEVRSTDVGRIIFGTAEDFFAQLARLDATLDRAPPHMESINLALGTDVVVSTGGADAAAYRPQADLEPGRRESSSLLPRLNLSPTP